MDNLLEVIDQKLTRLERVVSENRKLLNDIVAHISALGVDAGVIRQAQVEHGQALERLRSDFNAHILGHHKEKPKLTPLPDIAQEAQ